MVERTAVDLRGPAAVGRAGVAAERERRRGRALRATVTAVAKVCERCVSDLLYCGLRDAYLCPVCDRWVENACSDPQCGYCPGRPERPSECDHPDRHYSTD